MILLSDDDAIKAMTLIQRVQNLHTYRLTSDQRDRARELLEGVISILDASRDFGTPELGTAQFRNHARIVCGLALMGYYEFETASLSRDTSLESIKFMLVSLGISHTTTNTGYVEIVADTKGGD